MKLPQIEQSRYFRIGFCTQSGNRTSIPINERDSNLAVCFKAYYEIVVKEIITLYNKLPI